MATEQQRPPGARTGERRRSGGFAAAACACALALGPHASAAPPPDALTLADMDAGGSRGGPIGDFEPPTVNLSAAAARSVAPDANPFTAPMTPELQPIEVQYVRRYLVALDRNLAGRYASPAFRNPLSDLQVYFALQTWGQGTGVLQDRSSSDMRTLTLLAAAMSMSAEDVATDLLADVPALSFTHKVIRTASSPSIKVQKSSGQKKMAVGTADRTDRNAAMATAALDQDTRQRAPSSLRTGTGLQLRSLNDDEETPLVDGAVYVMASRIGVDAWRISGLALARTWSFYARQRMVTGWHLTFSTGSRSDSPVPSAYTASVLTELAGPWQWRTYFRRVIPYPDRNEELKVGVELRALWRWRALQRPDGPALGDRLPYDGPESPGTGYRERYQLTRLYTPTPAAAPDGDEQVAVVEEDDAAP